MFRFGLVGAGRMGRTHLRALASSEAVRIVAVAEVDEVGRKTAAAEYGLESYSTLEELIAHASIDGVLVASPTDTHAFVVEAAVRANLPVLCEKPCGSSPEEARHLAQVVETQGAQLQVGYWRRFVPALAHLQERIRGGELGDVLSLVCSQWDRSPPPASFRVRSGGIAVDMGVHEIDQARWLLGSEAGFVTGVSSSVVTDPAAGLDPDCAHLIARMTSGESLIISLGRYYPGGDMVRVEVFGTRGHVLEEILTPSEGERVQLEALERQAVAFAEAAGGGVSDGASLSDAIAALEFAILAEDQLERRALQP